MNPGKDWYEMSIIVEDEEERSVQYVPGAGIYHVKWL